MKIKYDDMRKINILSYIIDHNVHNKINILKIIYFANKIHLQKYGREVVRDRYRAMDFGPVPFAFYDILKQISGVGEYNEDINLSEFFSSEYDGVLYFTKIKTDKKYLSKTDEECLDQAIEEFGPLSFNQLREKISEDQAYSATPNNDEISFKKIVKSLPNNEELLEYLEFNKI